MADIIRTDALAQDKSLPLIAVSVQMRKIQDELRQAARSDAKILLTGESGVGKEVISRLVHEYSPRRARPFVAINCAGVPDTLLESELFGHVRGSFTGAYRDKPGLLEQAHGGTIFLDEIGEMSLRMQALLLRFLEDGDIHRVGADRRTSTINVRVVTATNRVLLDQIAAGAFREDLYYRINVIHLVIPPLRDRREEIPHLTSLFLREASERLGKPDVFLTAETLELLAQYWWPGNVRQLRNEIQRAVALGQAGLGIGPEHLSPEIVSASIRQPRGATVAASASDAFPTRPPATSLAQAVDSLEREIIEATLHQSSGNISEAARTLGLTRRGLYLKLRRLGFEAVPIRE